MDRPQTGSVASSASVKSVNVKDSFTVFCWNVLSGGYKDYRKAAMLKEMSDPPRDLVFLQEMNAKPDGRTKDEYIPYDKVPYKVHYTKEEPNIYNVILYNTQQFKEVEFDFNEVLLEAYYSLQWQVDCYKEWQNLQEETGDIVDILADLDMESLELAKELGDGEDILIDTLDTTFETDKEQEKYEKDRKQLEEELKQLGSKLKQKCEEMNSLQLTLKVAGNPTWEYLKEKVANKHTEENITKGVQCIMELWNKSRDTTHKNCKICAQKTIKYITCNHNCSSMINDIQVLVNCLLRESKRKNKKEKKEVRGCDFWTGILRHVTERFALTCLTYRKDEADVIVAVSFHNRKNQPKEMLHVLLYLLREFRMLLKARYQKKRFHILLAGDFNTDLFFYNPDTKGREYIDYLLEDYRPVQYELTGCRHHRIDHIMLWPDNATLTLGPVVPYVIDIPQSVQYYEYSDSHIEPSDFIRPRSDHWWAVYPGCKDHKRESLAQRMNFAKLVSNHDPLTTTLEITTVKIEPKETTDQPSHGHSNKGRVNEEHENRSTKKEGHSNEEGFNVK